MKLFALILALSLLLTAAQGQMCKKDEDCGNLGMTSDNPFYKCCARFVGTKDGERYDKHMCL